MVERLSVAGAELGWGAAPGKTAAKKKAAFMALVRLYQSAGICDGELEKAMWKTFDS